MHLSVVSQLSDPSLCLQLQLHVYIFPIYTYNENHLSFISTLLSPHAQAKFDIQSKFKSLQSEHGQLQETLDEEMDGKSSLQSQLTSAKAEAANWKNKFETEAAPRIEELEDGKWVIICV